jgi:prepilin-type N-terminal cleavage/methylation domain-containing protein
VRGRPDRCRRGPAGGFSLIEVLVAIVLLAIGLLGMAPLTMVVAKMSRQATALSQRAAAMSAEVARVGALAWAALPPGPACTRYATATFPHERCLTVVDLTPRTKRVTIVVTPDNWLAVASDTVVMDRGRGGASNPLNAP